MTFKEWCDKSNLSRKEISEGLMISEAYVSFLCSGNRVPSTQMIWRIKRFTHHQVDFEDWVIDEA